MESSMSSRLRFLPPMVRTISSPSRLASTSTWPEAASAIVGSFFLAGLFLPVLFVDRLRVVVVDLVEALVDVVDAFFFVAVFLAVVVFFVPEVLAAVAEVFFVPDVLDVVDFVVPVFAAVLDPLALPADPDLVAEAEDLVILDALPRRVVDDVDVRFLVVLVGFASSSTADLLVLDVERDVTAILSKADRTC
mgnify:FL=1